MMRKVYRDRAINLTRLDSNAEFGRCAFCGRDLILEPRALRVWHEAPECLEFQQRLAAFHRGPVTALQTHEGEILCETREQS
jgi:hypothetical protein